MRIRLEDKLPSGKMRIIGYIQKEADRRNIHAYIVGGPVRDILLGKCAIDIDIVIDSDAISFASLLSKKYRKRVILHRAFRTACLDFDGDRIDIVTARRETYKEPAAYPDVEPAGIREDLQRRDFTINAMAVSINRKDIGRLVDFYGGYDDLRKGVIRVMHDRSFIDDPTRIFRAVRFSARFAFRIEPHTKRLMREAIARGMIARVNRGRIKKEIELLLKEDKPVECIRLFESLV